MLDFHGYGASVFEGAWLTLEVALLSLVVAVALGLAGALAKLSRSLVLRTIAGLYTTIIRGMPDLVLMLLIYFGGQTLVNVISDALGWEYIDINPFVAGVLTIGLIFGAYMTETFRGALMAVPKGQLEAGYAYGMSATQVFVRIHLPQMLRYALPALVSVIGLDDIVRKAQLAAGATRLPFTFYGAVLLGFLAFTTVSVLLLRWAERRYSLGYERME
ncbi:MAG: ABC transporter permease [Tabrizicola sp.]|nr:ABC transporter permease [Tabrizicola sp.]